MSLHDLIERAEAGPNSDAKTAARVDLVVYLTTKAHAIAELIEAAEEIVTGFDRTSVAKTEVSTHDLNNIRAALAKLNGDKT